MARYRKKPVEIDAVQFDGSSTGVSMIQHWMITGELRVPQVRTRDCGRTVDIETLEGVMIASPGDWIIRGVRGEFYPCKPDVFALTYDEVDAP